MTRWANHDEIGSDDVFKTLHAGLTVALIATPRKELMTCFPSETVSEVIARNTEPFDFLPVVERDDNDMERIIGLCPAASFSDCKNDPSSVSEHFDRLSEEYLIGDSASILDFVKSADAHPCRLVVSGGTIAGLVSLSDLQKLPVRAALFALITGFEMTMAEAIEVRLQKEANWLACLDRDRQRDIRKQIYRSKRDDGYVNELLFTTFKDKTTIILKKLTPSEKQEPLEKKLTDLRELRNKLAHANEYASTPVHARNVCAAIRDLLEIRTELSNLIPKDPKLESLEIDRSG